MLVSNSAGYVGAGQLGHEAVHHQIRYVIGADDGDHGARGL
ncbi:hypothetical protein [Streptomyces lunaelactis]|nr:hypothetical protein [Streptomyces lunaelactis]